MPTCIRSPPSHVKDSMYFSFSDAIDKAQLIWKEWPSPSVFSSILIVNKKSNVLTVDSLKNKDDSNQKLISCSIKPFLTRDEQLLFLPMLVLSGGFTLRVSLRRIIANLADMLYPSPKWNKPWEIWRSRLITNTSYESYRLEFRSHDNQRKSANPNVWVMSDGNWASSRHSTKSDPFLDYSVSFCVFSIRWSLSYMMYSSGSE